MSLAAPFPYFGAKSAVAPEVWKRLGNVGSYVEPFFGSGAMLLARPDSHQWESKTETVNDLDGMISNFWRAVSADSEAVAHYADWPVNENDLHARHAWLVGQKESLQSRLEGNPDYYDAKVAGWWCWGMCCWIASGWCSGKGPWSVVDGELVNTGNAGMGINRKLVHLSDAGMGVNRKLVHLSDAGNLLESASQGILEWMVTLSNRLRRVRVCCGDWQRVVGSDSAMQATQGIVGIFLDPPYAESEGRDMGVYAVDSGAVVHDVCTSWAIGHGGNKRLRIALCGYDSFDMPEGWSVYRWTAHGGYGRLGEGRGKENRGRETIWFSPACLGAEGELQRVMF